MKESIIVQTDIKDKIRLENKFDFNAKLTVGLAEGGDFFLIINFVDLKTEEFEIVARLSREPRRLSIKSDLIDKEQYRITHIVITKFSSNSQFAMTWDCLSDDPSLYDDLTI